MKLKSATKLATAIVASGAIAGSAHAVSTKIGDTTLTIGGFIKADMMFTDFEDGPKNEAAGRRADKLLVPSLIPRGNPDGSVGYEFNTNIETSRINFKTVTPVGEGKLTTYIETDFLTAEGDERFTNAYGERLRHAFLDWSWNSTDSIRIGQNWSTFFNVGALPESIDFIGPTSGVIFNRQFMLRYTKKVGSGSFMLALENPSNRLTAITDTSDIDDSAIPDLIARYNGKSGSFSWTIAGMLRELAVDGVFNARAAGVDPTGATTPAVPGTAFDDSKVVGAVSLSGKLALHGKNDLKFMISSGTMGRYFALQAFNDGTIDANGEIDETSATGGFLAYRHWWNHKTRSTIQYATATGDIADAETGDLLEEISNFEINLITSPAKNLDLGIGYIHATAETEGDVDGTMNRIQFTGKAKF